MELALLSSLLVIAIGLVAFSLHDHYQGLRNKRRGCQLVPQHKGVEGGKEPEILEKIEPEDQAKVLELPEELLELLGLSEEKANNRGLIETAWANFIERKRLKSEIKTRRMRRAYMQEALEDDRLDTAFIETRIQRLKTQFEAGLISQRQLALLSQYLPEVFEMVTEAKELRRLKHLAEMTRLEVQIAELQTKAKRDGLEGYRERYRRLTEKIIADVKGRHQLREALMDVVEEIAKQMGKDGRSEAEIKLLKSQLMRDIEQKIINLGEEIEEEMRNVR